MPYSLDNDLDIFYDSLNDTPEERIEALRANDLKRYRVKTIISGQIVESEIYPIWNTNQKGKLKKFNESRPEQKNLDEKNRRKKITRLLNGNFTEEDTYMTLKYSKENRPKDEKQAKKDIQNYIRVLQRHCEKNGLPKLNYIYVTEIGAKGAVHHHIVMNFCDREFAESKWTKEKYPKAVRLKPTNEGLEDLGNYLSKDLKGSKSYGYSLGLYKPWEYAKIADSKVSKRQAEKIATGKTEPKTFFEDKLYRDKDYAFRDVEVKVSPFVSGCYIYARMKNEGITSANAELINNTNTPERGDSMNTEQTVDTLNFCKDIPKEIEFKNSIGREAETGDLSSLHSEIMKELDKLPYREKRILQMFYINGEQWEKISRLMNYSPTQCKRIRQLALRELSAFFGANPTISKFVRERKRASPQSK